MKSAFITIIGRPSAGKSTLLNSICGHKISIVSPVPQTTRNRIRGVYTCPSGQLVFLDTPGFHTSENKLNRRLTDLIKSSVAEVDLLLYVVDVSRKPGEEEAAISQVVANGNIPSVVAINKIDLRPGLIGNMESYIKQRIPKAQVVPISATEGRGKQDLIDLLLLLAPEGEKLYPDEFYTDQDPEFRISEIIREKTITKLREEVPHAVYVEVADMEISENEKELWIRVFIHTERDSQKAIIIGKGGERIRQIRRESHSEIKALFPYRINLDIRVKVSRDWRKQDFLLNRLIY